MIPKPTFLRRAVDLVFRVPEFTPDSDLIRMHDEIREHFSGHRAVVLRGDDVQILPIPQPRRRPYRPSMVANGGRA